MGFVRFVLISKWDSNRIVSVSNGCQMSIVHLEVIKCLLSDYLKNAIIVKIDTFPSSLAHFMLPGESP